MSDYETRERYLFDPTIEAATCVPGFLLEDGIRTKVLLKHLDAAGVPMSVMAFTPEVSRIVAARLIELADMIGTQGEWPE